MIAVTRQRNVVVCPSVRDQRRDQWPKWGRLELRRALVGPGREPGEQIGHLADRRPERRDHVGAKLGIVGVTLGISSDQ